MIYVFNISDYVVYKRDVCIIKDVKRNYYKNRDYYVLVPVYDDSLRIDVPVDSTLLRAVIIKERVYDIIQKIPDIKIIEEQDKVLENIYKDLLYNGGYDGLIRIIKTTYVRNKDRIDNKKKISEKDNMYFDLAERYLYSEFSVSLGMSYDDTKNYVINEVKKIKEH